MSLIKKIINNKYINKILKYNHERNGNFPFIAFGILAAIECCMCLTGVITLDGKTIGLVIIIIEWVAYVLFKSMCNKLYIKYNQIQ